MSTVSSLPVCGNSPRLDLVAYANDLLAGPVGLNRWQAGHRDESAALLADPDDVLTPADMAQALAAMVDDADTQRADDAAIREMRDAVTAAKERFGVSSSITFSRTVSVGTLTGERTDYTVVMVTPTAGFLSGVGPSPALALDDLTAKVDARLVPEFGGYRLPGVALVIGGHYRTNAEALAFARRIAVDPAYLDVLLRFHTPGVIELRDEPPGTPAVAVAA